MLTWLPILNWPNYEKQAFLLTLVSKNKKNNNKKNLPSHPWCLPSWSIAGEKVCNEVSIHIVYADLHIKGSKHQRRIHVWSCLPWKFKCYQGFPVRSIRNLVIIIVRYGRYLVSRNMLISDGWYYCKISNSLRIYIVTDSKWGQL